MSLSKPRLNYTQAVILNRHDMDIRQLFALVRSRPTPTSIQTPIPGTANPNPTPVTLYPFTEPGQNYGDVGLMTVNIDLEAQSAGYTKMRLTGNISLAFNNPPTTGNVIIFYLDMTQDGVGGRTVTFPGTVANPPTINTGANARNVIMCYTFDAGATYTALNLVVGSGAFANTSLSNLSSPTAVNQHLQSGASGTLDLGSGTSDWRDLYIQRIRLRTGGPAIIVNVPNIIRDASDNMVLNVNTAKKISFSVFGGEVGYVDSVGFTHLGSLFVGGQIAAGSHFISNSATTSIDSTVLDINSAIINLGNTTGDRIDFEGRVGTDIDPNSAGLRDIGSAVLPWRNLNLAGIFTGVDVVLTGEIDMTGGGSGDDIRLGGSNFLRVGSSSGTAIAGGATLPANPVGFLRFKDPAGNIVRVPYYN